MVPAGAIGQMVQLSLCIKCTMPAAASQTATTKALEHLLVYMTVVSAPTCTRRTHKGLLLSQYPKVRSPKRDLLYTRVRLQL